MASTDTSNNVVHGMSPGEKWLQGINSALLAYNTVRGNVKPTAESSNTDPRMKKGATEVLVQALAMALKSLGFGKYDEAGYAKLFGLLTPEEKIQWTKLIEKLRIYEREPFKLSIFLMDTPETRNTETQIIAEVKDTNGKVTQPRVVVEKQTNINEKSIGLEFMRGLLNSVNISKAEDGYEEVAQMLRENKLLGDESTFKRFMEQNERLLTSFNSYLEKLNKEIDEALEPEPVNLFLRLVNLLLASGGEKAEKIFQGDGLLFKPILRMLGLRTKPTKRSK